MSSRRGLSSLGAAATLWLALGSAGTNVWAAPMMDPTRPPEWGAAASQHPAGPELQSVMLMPGYRAAVIDGHTVRLGERYRGARLVRITAESATLRTAKSRRILKLRRPSSPDGARTVPTPSEPHH